MNAPLSICRLVAEAPALAPRAAPGGDWRVLKFGGTSVATPERLAVLRGEVLASARTHRVAVVVSALAGVTDALVALVARTLAGEDPARPLGALRARHLDLLGAVAPHDAGAEARVRAIARRLAGLLSALAEARTADEHARAEVLAVGEELAATIVHALLREVLPGVERVEPTEVLRARGFALDAEPDPAATAAATRARLARSRAPAWVVGGFQAARDDGTRVLLGRGGSDTSATLLGEALGADRVEIWTDVDGVFSADPRLVPDARLLPRLGYAAAASLARHGAKVLHARSIAPVERARIPLHVRNTARPQAAGTVIDGAAANDVLAVAAPAPDAGVATVALVGAGDGAGDARRHPLAAALAAHAVAALDVAPGVDAQAVVVRVPAAQREAAVRVLHAAAGGARRVDVVLAGARGQVGSALRRLLAREARDIAARAGIDLRLRALFDRRGIAEAADGVDESRAAPAFVARRAGDWTALRDAVLRAGHPAVFVDCTASEDIAALYESLLDAGIAVAGANKHAGAGELARWSRLSSLDATRAPWRRETTVGAALPVLSTLRGLRARGEAVLGIEGVLSGSLSHVLARLHEGVAFSAAVAEARAKGYTEPDPREDLAARDLVRKLVILARESGAPLEAAQVAVEPLVDAQSWDPDAPDGATDFRWRQRADDAEARGRRLVAVAAWDAQGARVGVRAEWLDSPLARLRPGENLLRIRSEFHDAIPLVISGPGAGPEATAAGVLGDLVDAATVLLARPRAR
jgi:aspartokinase/homoserine dehydrogenase 1